MGVGFVLMKDVSCCCDERRFVFFQEEDGMRSAQGDRGHGNV